MTYERFNLASIATEAVDLLNLFEDGTLNHVVIDHTPRLRDGLFRPRLTFNLHFDYTLHGDTLQLLRNKNDPW